jgi:rhodanese-related sulfurtransferase
MSNRVTETSAAASAEVAAHYARRLSFETDCNDVYVSMLAGGDLGFVLLDVRGPKLYEKGHVPGALNLPVGKMTERRMNEWPADTLFVVYCAGPHCNGTDKAALRLSQLRHKVKVMIGGITGWEDEGYGFATGTEPGSVAAPVAA